MRARQAVIVVLVVASLLAALLGGYAHYVQEAGVGAAWPRILAVVGATLVGSSWALTGGILAWLRPRNVVGWMLLLVGSLTQVSVAEEALAAAGGGARDVLQERPAGLVLSLAVGFSIYCMLALLPALYPTGRLPSRRWVVPCLVVVAGACLMQWQWLGEATASQGFSPWVGEGVQRWLPAVVYATGVAAVWVLSVVRMLRAVFPVRLQLVWLFGAVVVTLAAQFLGDGTGALLVQMVCLYALPAAVAVGTVRYKLLGLEIVVRGALVYGVLIGAIIALQAGLAAVAGIRLSGAALPAVIAASVVAVGLNPLRTRLQRTVDRFVHGERAEPFHAVSDLGGLVALSSEADLLGEMLAGVRDAVRAQRVCLRDSDGRMVAEVGAGREADGGAGGPSFATELTVSGTRVGFLEVSAHTPGGRYTTRDELLLSTMASQVAVVVRTLELTGELGRERDAVLGATAAERRRLRRDLHDGLGPSLTGVRLGVEAIGDALRAGEHQRASEITTVLRDEMAGTVTEMRRILTHLGPLVLSEGGLVAALQRRVDSLGSAIRVEVCAADLPRLPPDVEEVAYLVAAEALTNVVKHSGATTASVRVGLRGRHLLLRVSDNGGGFLPGTRQGIGMDSMRERAEALDGQVEVATSGEGTAVTLTVPLVRAPR